MYSKNQCLHTIVDATLILGADANYVGNLIIENILTQAPGNTIDLDDIENALAYSYDVINTETDENYLILISNELHDLTTNQ